MQYGYRRDGLRAQAQAACLQGEQCERIDHALHTLEFVMGSQPLVVQWANTGVERTSMSEFRCTCRNS